MIKRFLLYFVLLIALSLILSSCKKDEEDQPTDVQVSFQMMHGAKSDA